MKGISILFAWLLLLSPAAFSQNFEWAKWFQTDSDEDNFNAVCTDDSGHVFVAIQFNTVMTVAGETFSSASVEDVLIIKMDSTCNPIWANQISSLYWDQVNGIDCDAEGNVFITGHYFGNLTVQTPPCLAMQEVGNFF